MSFFHSKPKGANPEKMLIDLRVMDAEIRQPYNRFSKEVQNSFSLIASYVRRSDKDSLYRTAHKVAKSKRSLRAHDRILKAVRAVRDNAQELSRAALQKQPIPQNLIPEIRILATVPDALKAQSFAKFRSTFLVQMYGKREVQNLCDVERIDPDVRFGLYDECVNDGELTAVFGEFVEAFPDLRAPLEAILGFAIGGAVYAAPGAPASPFSTEHLTAPAPELPEVPRSSWQRVQAALQAVV